MYHIYFFAIETAFIPPANLWGVYILESPCPPICRRNHVRSITFWSREFIFKLMYNAYRFSSTASIVWPCHRDLLSEKSSYFFHLASTWLRVYQLLLLFITYSINIFPDTVHFPPCDTGVLSDDTGEEREKQSYLINKRSQAWGDMGFLGADTGDNRAKTM